MKKRQNMGTPRGNLIKIHVSTSFVLEKYRLKRHVRVAENQVKIFSCVLQALTVTGRHNLGAPLKLQRS